MSTQKNTRREFFKGATIAAAAVATTGALGFKTAQAAPTLPDKWDKETDVLVVGAGATGQFAGLQALQSGAKVLILETRSVVGGNHRWAGGCDWPEFTYDQIRASSPDANAGWQKVMIGNVHADNKWLIDMGANLVYTAGKLPGHSAYRCDPAWTVNGVNSKTEFCPSGALVEFLGNKIKEAGGEYLFETSMVKLITDAKGAVVGVVATDKNGAFTIKANRAVILGTGGYGANPAMRMAFLGKNAGNIRVRGVETNVGSGIAAALEIGGMVDPGVGGFYGNLMPAPPALWETKLTNQGFSLGWALRGIAVNQHGVRFYDESEEILRQITAQPDGRAYLIFDDKIKTDNAKFFENVVASGAVIQTGQTIEELAKKLDEWGDGEFSRSIDGHSVIATFNEYNAAVAADKSLELKPPRRGNAKKLETPPFYAIEAWGGITDAFGGLLTDTSAHVLDKFGRPIPRLYAGGADGTRLFQYDHPGVIGGLVQGRIAGKNAAGEKPWDNIA